MSKAQQAAALRAQLQKDAPEMLAWMESMKADFGAAVLHVRTPNIEVGKPLPAGIVPYIPVPSGQWQYKVGESAAQYYSIKGKKR